MNILFWMDHPSTFNEKKDSTYLLIHECIVRGFQVYYIHDVEINNSELMTTVQKIHSFDLNQKITVDSQMMRLPQSSIHAIWIRKDPPVDEAYVRHLLIFQQFNQTVSFFNDPLGVLKTNEKLVVTQFPHLTPKTLVTQNKDGLLEFISQQDTCVLKPLNGFGGQGIFKISKNNTNLLPLLELLTHHFTQQIICQTAVRHEGGDKRIILVNQHPIGAINRVNPNGHRNNFMAGGHAEKVDVTSKDLKIIEAIAPMLKENGLFFVGIDILDGYLIEINVTSPTGLQEVNHLNSDNTQDIIIDAMEKVIKEKINA